MSEKRAVRIGVKVLKIFGWIVFSIVALLVIVALSIQIPWVQNKIKQEAVAFLENKIGTEVQLEHFSLAFPKKVVVEGFYMEDQSGDTLVYAGRLAIDTDLWALTDNTIELNQIELENFLAQVQRSEADSSFNFDYILEAFASDTTQADTTSSAAWKFAVGDIELTDIRLNLNDSLSGNHANVALGRLDVSMEEFDLEQSLIKVDEINLNRLQAMVTQTKMPVQSVADSAQATPADTAAMPFNMGFNEINLADINAEYTQTALGQSATFSLGELQVEANEIDLAQQRIDLAQIAIVEPYLSYEQLPGTEQSTGTNETKPTAASGPAQQPWQVALNEFDLKAGTIQFDNHNAPSQKGVVDFNHLWVTNLAASMRNLRYNGEQIQALISQFRFREKSGFQLEALRAGLDVSPDSLDVRNFYLRTGNSLLRFNAKAKYASMEALAESPEETLFSLVVDPSTLGIGDLAYFSPSMLDSLPVNIGPGTEIRINAAADGSLENLDLDHIQLHALQNTSLFANGKLRNVMEPDKMSFNVYLDKLHTIEGDIKRLLPDSLIPPTIAVPEWISLKGHYEGTTEAMRIQTTLNSSFGSADVRTRLDLNESARENYNAELAIHEFDMGELLKQPQQMGPLSMVAAVNGSGLSMEKLDALFKVRVNKFLYSGYTYRDFKIDGSMKKYFFSGKASMLDQNLNFVLTGDLDYTNEEPHYGIELDVKNADLRKLKLTPKPMKLKGEVVVDLKTPDFQKLNGNVGIRDFAMFNGEKLYSVDSLLFASIDQEGRSEVSIRSDIVSGEFKGSINLFSLPDLLSRHFNRYFSLRDTTYAEPVEDQHFNFDLVIKNTELITEILLPGLEPFVPGNISGEFNSAEHKLDIDVDLAQINYSGISFDSISFKVLSDPKSLDFTLDLEQILVDTLNIKQIRLAANVMNDSVRTNFAILDSLDREKYYLGGVIHSFEDAFQFRFLQDQITLNYEKWTAPLYNSLRVTDNGLNPNNFFIRRGDERILLLEKNNADSTLSLMFNKVDLKNITSLVEGTTPVGGLIDGELTLASAKKGAFETNLSITNLKILEQLWGDLKFSMNKSETTPMNFKLDLTGEDAKLEANGFVSTDDNPDMLLEATLSKLNLAIVEPLTMGQAKNLEGQLRGRLTLQGKTSEPEISGQFTFDNTSFFSTFTQTTFAIADETVYLRQDDIVFDKFQIMDGKKNKAVLDGLVSSIPQGGFDLRLKLTADDFHLINTTQKDNDLFYGNVRINTEATITGNTFLPVIKMNVSLSDESELTFVVPQAEKGIMEQKGVVVFIDRSAVNDPFMQDVQQADTLDQGFKGMDLTANIELSEEERFNVVIDPATGDKLSVRGNSTLTFHMDATGDMQLTGRYEITEGSYNLTFAKFVKREFDIAKGSTIVWTGDPLRGQMDISAIYTVETTPADLVANIVSDEELTQYKKEVPFEVYLILEGELLFPDISFRLEMAEEDRNEFGGNVYAMLQDINQQESDLNKQVFALLILKRFISDNPFESEGGGSLAGSARKSVSRLLSEQLNRLSSNVKGVELSFDVNSYEDATRGGQAQTELELGVQKSLLNDRLVVKVSGNVNVEGETQEQNSVTDFIGDLALEYKLTEDGRIRITGFRNTEYDLINGDIIETGAGLIYIKDYNTLKELFKPNAEDE